MSTANFEGFAIKENIIKKFNLFHCKITIKNVSVSHVCQNFNFIHVFR